MPHNDPQTWLDHIQSYYAHDKGVIYAVVMGSLIRVLYKRNIRFWVAVLNIISMLVIMKFVGPAFAAKYDLGASGVTGVGIIAGMFGSDIIRGLFKLGDIFARDPGSFTKRRK